MYIGYDLWGPQHSLRIPYLNKADHGKNHLRQNNAGFAEGYGSGLGLVAGAGLQYLDWRKGRREG